MKLSAEKIQFNWVEFNTNIEQHITGDRKQKLLDFYKENANFKDKKLAYEAFVKEVYGK